MEGLKLIVLLKLMSRAWWFSHLQLWLLQVIICIAQATLYNCNCVDIFILINSCFIYLYLSSCLSVWLLTSVLLSVCIFIPNYLSVTNRQWVCLSISIHISIFIYHICLCIYIYICINLYHLFVYMYIYHSVFIYFLVCLFAFLPAWTKERRDSCGNYITMVCCSLPGCC